MYMRDGYSEKEPVKVYYDAEFTGLNRNTSLVSIGLVSESGAHFYAEFDDYDKSQVDQWLQDHVIVNLLFNKEENGCITTRFTDADERYHFDVDMRGSRSDVAKKLLEWFNSESADDTLTIQMFCDCYAYDWVLICDLLSPDGNAMNIPPYINYIPIDLSTALYMKDIDPDISREEFVGDQLEELERQSPFDVFSGFTEDFSDLPKDCRKHNSLWDAAVCKLCFEKLSEENSED